MFISNFYGFLQDEFGMLSRRTVSQPQLSFLVHKHLRNTLTLRCWCCSFMSWFQRWCHVSSVVSCVCVLTLTITGPYETSQLDCSLSCASASFTRSHLST